MSEQRRTLSDDGLTLRWRRSLLFERLGDAAVKLLAPTAQQRAIGGVLDEGMLEDESFLRRQPRRKINPAPTSWSSASRSRSSGRSATAASIS